MDEIFRTAFYQRHNVALNVGSENASNRVSFAYDNDEGVLINTFNKNLSLRYNGKFKLNKWVTITEDVVWKNNESRSKDTDSGYTGVVAAAMYMPASATVYNPLETRLLREAKEAGCQVIGGIGMLLWQGAAAFRLFTGKEMPVKEVEERFFAE